jgi:hypothetical protein
MPCWRCASPIFAVLQSVSSLLFVLQEGYSLWSAVSSATTAATAPGSPVGLVVVGINRSSVTLAWQPPAHDGGSAVQAYQVLQ